MFFLSKPKRLIAQRQKIEDEIMGYLITRKTPPAHLVAKASRIKMDLELMQRQPARR
jgi:hypothetical protein